MPARLRSRLRYGGGLSYPLYLVHSPVIVTLHCWFGVASPAALLIVPLLAAVLLYHGVDAPLRRHRRARRREA